MPRWKLVAKAMLWSLAVPGAFYAGGAWKERQFRTERSDWIDQFQQQEQKHEWLLVEYRKLHCREVQEQQQQQQRQHQARVAQARGLTAGADGQPAIEDALPE
ncbi:MAG TPA: hypothetical protein VHC22_21025 [Pirellulales bacterium]|nr:hypothetical protein [Pirellulales bacterium]